MGRFKLPPGRYCIVPSTFDPNQEGDFLLRIYSLKSAGSVTLDEKTAIVDVPQQPESKSPETIAAETAMRDKFRAFFEKITGDDMEVDAWELHEILNAALKKGISPALELKGTDGFSVDACKALVSSCDMDRSGKLGFEEFMQLWMDIRKWKDTFAKYDKDRSGTFNIYELREALRTLGYSVSEKILGALTLRFANRQGLINLDDFISCIVKLRHLHNSFKENSSRNVAQFNLDEFMAVGIYS
jgi:calpain